MRLTNKNISFTCKHKGKVHPRTGQEGPETEQNYRSTLSLTSAIDGDGWLKPWTGRFSPGQEPDTHFTGGWVGPRAGLDGCGKSRPPTPPPEFYLRIVQLVASFAGILFNAWVLKITPLVQPPLSCLRAHPRTRTITSNSKTTVNNELQRM